jgi:hypothetical protein
MWNNNGVIGEPSMSPSSPESRKRWSGPAQRWTPTSDFVWRTLKPGKTSNLRPTVVMMAGLTDHHWDFNEFFDSVMKPV